MLGKIRKRMTYANVLMTFALVFAMTGGAYAAKKYLITSTKQISPGVLKALAGKPGPAGAEGKAGAPGAPGKDGAQGLKGDTGAEGKEGKQGIQGLEGKEGKEGSPWTAGGTLPSGKTETGLYFIVNTEIGYIALASFNIPLATKIGKSNIKIVSREAWITEKVPAECDDGVEPAASLDHPEADPGYFCVFVGNGENPLQVEDISISGTGVGTTGAVLKALGLSNGTWAVTAP